jgi:glutathione S-transferase
VSVRLITIPISHYCEKARWGLERAGLAYVEEPHPPLLHWPATWRACGGDSTPVLVGGEEVLGDSTDILRWIAKRRPEIGLLPADRRAEVDELEELFDETLGPHVRRWVYSYVLDDAPLTRRLLTAGARRREQLAYRVAQPAITASMRRMMQITPESAQRSRRKIDEVFSAVDARLADGRRYLCGDRFTAADLTFAALGAPVVLAEGYGPSWLPVPRASELPPAMRAELDLLRARPAGAFILRMYREERRPPRAD